MALAEMACVALAAARSVQDLPGQSKIFLSTLCGPLGRIFQVFGLVRGLLVAPAGRGTPKKNQSSLYKMVAPWGSPRQCLYKSILQMKGSWLWMSASAEPNL